MSRRWLRGSILALGFALAVTAGAAAPDRETPAEFEPFEYLVCGWKGMSLPAANKIKGWPEKHVWAWKFAKGVPAGLVVTVEGGKVLSKGVLTFDTASKTYRLETSDPKGEKGSFVGKLDPNGKLLTLDKQGGVSKAPKERLSIRLMESKITYKLRYDRKELGTPQFAPVIETDLTKEGESFAAGSGANDAPKCIVTGGTATTTVSYQGQTFPICCSGCRDEFNENPEKYIQKALLRAKNATGSGSAKSVATTSAVAPKDAPATAEAKPDSMPEAKAKSTAKTAAKSKSSAKTAGDDDATETNPATAKKSSSSKTAAPKAVSLLRQAQSFEKSGKKAAALTYYKRIAKEYPESPQAKTAKERIKALSEE